jgi:hypothetical protein
VLSSKQEKLCKLRAAPGGFCFAYGRLGKAKFDNPERKKSLGHLDQPAEKLPLLLLRLPIWVCLGFVFSQTPQTVDGLLCVI